MEQKKYVWNFERMTALAVALANCLITGYISIIIVVDEYFLRHQLGLIKEPSILLKWFVVSLGFLMILWMNILFIKRNHKARMVIGFIQTMTLAFFIRNLFVGFMYSGFVINSYVMNIVGLIVLSVLIFNTLFSEKIMGYFNLIKK